MKEEGKKAGLKFNIQKTKIMASSPITSWQIDGETMETVTDFIFLGCKITADDDCSHEIKRRLFLRRKAMTNLDSILKGRDITLPTKVHRVKAIVFKVVVYGCDRCHSVHLAKSFQELHQSFKFFYPIFLPPFFFHTHQACIIGPLSPPTPAKPEGLTGSSCPTCNYTWALLSRRVSPDTVSFHHSTDKDTGIQKLNIMP